MKPLMVRGVEIGSGVPKICVPVMGKNVEEVLEAAKLAAGSEIDMIEWRADWLECVLDRETVMFVLKELRTVLEDVPIIFTFRTKREGGEQELDEKEYMELNQLAAESGYVDFVDLEMVRMGTSAAELAKLVQEQGVYVIGSNHDFQKTPDEKDLIHRLCWMQEMGADVLKIAVMPQNSKDVLRLLGVTEEMVSKYAKKPVVTMSMSSKGVISRISGETFGSAITFGALHQSSAPGQVPVKELKRMLEVIHDSI